MRRIDAGRAVRAAVLGIFAASLAGALAGCGVPTAGSGYGYGAYYGSPWGYDPWYGGGAIYVGPPADIDRPGTRPPASRPPHVSHQPVRPMPPPRPMPRGAGRRR